MFVAEALFNFSKATMLQQAQPQKQQEPLYKNEEQKQKDDDSNKEKNEVNKKRKRSESLDKQQKQIGEDKQVEQQGEKEEVKGDDITYLSFQKGQKILVEQAFDNGWWFGSAIKRPDDKGFFPSNYVKVGAKPPPPPPPKESQGQQEQQNDEQEQEYDPTDGRDWVNKQLQQLGQVQKGAVTSDYYHGIKGYKYVKINDNNKNILNANYVKFDVATGLAKVPIKDQAPCSKAVRQMGYYFDYHQWNQQKNSDPAAFRNRPDPRKKKKKKLRLLGMGKQG